MDMFTDVSPEYSAPQVPMTAALSISQQILEGLKQNKPARQIAAELNVKVHRVYTTKYLMKKKNKSKKKGKVGRPKKTASRFQHIADSVRKPIGRKELLDEVKPGLRALFGPKYEDPAPDMVNSPPHYTVGGIETIDFIEAKKLPHHLATAVAYIARAQHKGTEKQDIQKAVWYLNRYLNQLG